MKILKRIGLVLLSLPVLLILLFLFYELFGMCINHMAARQQTDQLRTRLEHEIPDIQILDVCSETGNTSGTGNHVDCFSSVTFSTELQESEIENRMSGYYSFDDWFCYVTKTEDGNYFFYLNTSAPFADNIEGH